MDDYWKYVEYPPIFSNIDWTQTITTGMEFEQKIPPLQQHVPFQRRRSSSVDLPINPLYLNSNKFTFGNMPIKEEETISPSKIGSSSTLEFPLIQQQQQYQPVQHQRLQQQQQQVQQQQHAFDFNFTPPMTDKKPTTSPPQTFFPELHRTSYNTMLGQQLQKHQKRRRSSSLPPVFKQQQKRVPTPLIFTQIQVTDPRPIQHTQKPKTDAKPIAIERVVKKKIPVETDPAEKQQQMDQALLNLNFEDVTVAELKDMLKERGLPNTGRKAVLTERLRQARDQLTGISASPAIQGIANMTIHSPLPIDDSFVDSSLYPTHYEYQPDINMNDFNSILEDTQFTSNDKRPPLTSWDSEWDQDRLDHFLTELV